MNLLACILRKVQLQKEKHIEPLLKYAANKQFNLFYLHLYHINKMAN